MKARGVTTKTRLEVLKRDNFTCVACDRTDRKLHVAHYLYLPYGRTIRKEEVGNLNSPENLLSLCQECHTIFDGRRRVYWPVSKEMRAEKNAIYEHNYHQHRRGFDYPWDGDENLAQERLKVIQRAEREELERRRKMVSERVNEYMKNL